MSFVHLHVHSQYSLLDGAITFEKLLSRAKEFNMPAVALTDHGNLHGTLEFYEKAKKAGIQPLLGVEGYFTLGDRRDRSPQFPTHHMVLLAKNQEGIRNLFRLVSIANFEGFYYRPRFDLEILTKHSKGLIGLSACLQGVPAQLILQNQEKKAEEWIMKFREVFEPESFYLELMDNGLPEQKKVNEVLIELGRKLSVPLVATNDCHYLYQKDARAQDVLICIGTGKTVSETDRMKFHSDQFYFRSPEEMMALFPSCPEAISNTLAIAQKCQVEFKLHDYHMPRFTPPNSEPLEECLKKKTQEGFNARWPAILEFYERKGLSVENLREKYESRLSKELGLIEKTGFSAYFLIVADFINFAKTHGIPVGPGRGSAAGSLVAYAINITDLDPIPHKLLFERFLNPDRISLPDIDVDFCQEGRDEVIRYVTEKYGGSTILDQTRVAQITTFGKMQARAAIRDVGRALGIPYGEVDRVAKMVPAVLNITLAEAFEQEPKFSELRKKDPKIDELLDTAVSLEGLARHASVHAAGVVISDDRPLVDHLPLGKGQHEEVVTQWDMKGVEKIGLVKFDFLGLKTLTVLQLAVKMVNETRGEKVDLLRLNLQDPKVYELLSRGETQGVFQLESTGMQDLVTRLKPNSFEDLIALVALYRPGPLGSGMVDDFINRKHGKTPIRYELSQLEDILKDTYGVILYQEQVMQIASRLANYSLGEADVLRRAMGKKIPAEMEQQESRFLDGCLKNKIPKPKAEKMFELMAKFAGYGFNKSHSAAYAFISFQTAYFKAHYPLEFMAATLTIDRSNTDRLLLLLADCRSQGLQVLPPDINESALEFSVTEGKIRFGLGAVKNVGDQSIHAILKAREAEGPFQDLFEFCERVDHSHVNRKVMESLIKCGAFDSSHQKRASMLAAVDMAIDSASQTQKDRLSGQTNLFGKEISTSSSRPLFPEVPEWEEMERLKAEKESVGFYITGHPLLKFSSQLQRYANTDTVNLSQQVDQSTVRLGGVIGTLKEITTRKGDRMAFATLEDLSGSVELVIFSDLYRYKSEVFKSEDPVFVVGKVDIGEEQAKIIVSNAALLGEAASLFQGTVHVAIDATAVDDSKLNRLKEVLKEHKGECPMVLHLRIPGHSETVLSLSRNFTITPSEALIQDISSVLGPTTQIHFGDTRRYPIIS